MFSCHCPILSQDMGLGHICEGLAEQTEGGLQTLVLWNNLLTYQGMGFLATALVCKLVLHYY